MKTKETIQGRTVSPEDLSQIRALRELHPEWSRYRLSRELASRWAWYTTTGQLKDMACRTLLNKLSERGLIDLPDLRCASPNRHRVRHPRRSSMTPARDSCASGFAEAPSSARHKRADKRWTFCAFTEPLPLFGLSSDRWAESAVSDRCS